MKTTIAAFLILISLFLFSACYKESLHSSGTTIENNIENNQESTLSTNSVNSYYEDDYPEWGTTGTNWPAPTVNTTYTPRPDMYLTLSIPNSLKDVLPAGSNHSPSPYIHVQWRKLNQNGSPAGKWYNYHPEKKAYNQLRIDTLPNWHPDLNYWNINVNARALPQGYLEFRTRLLLLPLDSNDKASATLWSTYHNSTENYYGYPDTGGGNPGDELILVNVAVDLDVSINNFSGTNVDHIVVTAFGNTTTYYSTSVTLRGNFQTNVRLNEPTHHAYTATVAAYSTSGSLASETKQISNSIYISTSSGSNPSVYFRNGMILNVQPTN
jgi:hypothetical protein